MSYSTISAVRMRWEAYLHMLLAGGATMDLQKFLIHALPRDFGGKLGGGL
jgi:hypothetical protein